MKKFEKALSEIKAGMSSAIYDAIAYDERTINYEYDFGNTTIMVEIQVVVGACTVIVPDVWIEREDSEHNSPKVIAAVKNVIPDYFTIMHKYEEDVYFERENERMLMAQMY